MVAFSPPRLFAAWRVEAPFSAASLFRWVLHSLLSVTRSVVLYDAESCSREDSPCERVGPCDTLPRFFFSALWLQRSRSLLVQEIQSAKDIDLTCFKTFPTKATTCLLVLIPLQDSIIPDLRFLLKFPATNDNEVLFQLPHVPLETEYSSSTTAGTTAHYRLG